MHATLALPEPAYKSHRDATPAVIERLQGLREISDATFSLDELKASCKSAAAEGVDPVESGITELGLMLSEEDYESLKSYARRLTIKRLKVRRRS